MSTQRKRNHLRTKWYSLLHRDSYSGRPALVCQEWRVYERFAEDVGQPPHENAVLCMNNPDRGFCPGNVKWGTITERMVNRRHCIMLTHDGRTMSASAWARHLGISRKSLSERLSRHPVEIALSRERPARKPRHLKLSNHKTSRFFGVSQRKDSRHWEARIKAGRRVLYFGFFQKESVANTAVQRGLLELKAEREVHRIRRAAKSLSRDKLIPRLRHLMFITSAAVRLLPRDTARHGVYQRPDPMPNDYSLPLPKDVIELLLDAEKKRAARRSGSRQELPFTTLAAQSQWPQEASQKDTK